MAWVINGEKFFTSNAKNAAFLVLAVDCEAGVVTARATN
jgi:alkylation response protein AidB-like acyl-CoA dehydrogenase